MPLWGNTDAANSKPLFPAGREVRPVAQMTTANITVAGANTIVFTANLPSSIANGQYVYSLDANNAVSRFFDTSAIDQNDVDFYRSNNSVRAIDTVNNAIRLANNTSAILQTGQTIYFGTAVAYDNTTTEYNYANDTILITTTRIANTQGTAGGGGSNVSNTQIGNVNVGWNRIVRKINNDGTIRFLKETLVALASPVAANVSSANTSSNSIFGGI
jgi:hypothetical protein